MKKIFIIALILMFLMPSVVAYPGSWRTHDEQVNRFKTLANTYPDELTHEVFGQTITGEDMTLFKLGNPDGGKILIDSSLHGWEDIGAEVFYLWFKWLLESGEPEAEKILNENYWLAVPVVNMGSYSRGNANTEECPTYGVDLNRNFVRGWSRASCGNGPYGTSTGTHAASEPETQAMKQLFEDYDPAIYINCHYGGGPMIDYRGNNDTFWSLVGQPTYDLWEENNIELHNNLDGSQPIAYHNFLRDANPSSSGYAVSDAYALGIEPFLIEVQRRAALPDAPPETRGPCPWDRNWGGTNNGYPKNMPIELLEQDLYPIYQHFFTVLSDVVAIEQPDDPDDPVLIIPGFELPILLIVFIGLILYIKKGRTSQESIYNIKK